MITINDKSQCCGCTACASICPKKCIEMKWDNEGFLYPVVDVEKCIKCGRCDKVCPVKNTIFTDGTKPTGFVVQIKNNQHRDNAAAGGFVYAVACNVINLGGSVCGATLTSEFQCEHIIINSIEDLPKIQGSKYIQSAISKKIFSELIATLKAGKPVLFTGTACQVEGFLNNVESAKCDMSNLFTLDVVCHSVPSQKVFDSYIQYIEKIYNDKIVGVKFRDKKYGYGYPTMHLIGQRRGSFYHMGIEADPWLRAFFSGLVDRPSCYACKFKKVSRRSDFTVWDCQGIREYYPSMDDDRGTTKLLVHSAKGMRLLQVCKESYRLEEVNVQKLLGGTGNKAIYESCAMNPERDRFMHDQTILEPEKLFDMYFPLHFVHRFKHYLRRLIYKMGLQRKIKYLVHLIRK